MPAGRAGRLRAGMCVGFPRRAGHKGPSFPMGGAGLASQKEPRHQNGQQNNGQNDDETQHGFPGLFLFAQAVAPFHVQLVVYRVVYPRRAGHKNHHADRSALGTNRDEREQTNGRLSCRIKFEEEAHYNAR